MAQLKLPSREEGYWLHIGDDSSCFSVASEEEGSSHHREHEETQRDLLHLHHRRRQLLLLLQRCRFRLLHPQIHLCPRPISFTTPQFLNLRILLFLIRSSILSYFLLLLYFSPVGLNSKDSGISFRLIFHFCFLAGAMVRGFGK